MRTVLSLALCASLVATVAAAENLYVVPPNGRIAELVRVPAGAETIYVSGQLADPLSRDMPPKFGDTRAQTVSILGKIQGLLQAQGFSLEDVVMMRVVLVGDPAKGGAMDFAGMNAGYAQFFGASAHKPARITTQVTALAAPGALVEIEVQAARTPAAR